MQRALHVVLLRVALGEITFDVIDRALQRVQPIAYALQLLACHDEFVLAETELGGTASRLVVALPA